MYKSIGRPWKTFFTSDEMELLKSVMSTIDNSGQDILPPRNEVLDIFRKIYPQDIKVIIVGQSPYPSVEDVCGIPFISRTRSTPDSLKNIQKEIQRQYNIWVRNPNDMILSWIDKGVFLINNSLTLGINLPKHHQYLGNHSIIWREFMSHLLVFLTKDPTIPVVLMGDIAWELDTFVKNSNCVLKVPHPTSRGTKTFKGCGVFEKINKFLVSTGK